MFIFNVVSIKLKTDYFVIILSGWGCGGVSYSHNWLEIGSRSFSPHCLTPEEVIRTRTQGGKKKKMNCVSIVTQCPPVPEQKPPQHIQSAEITPAHSVGPRTHAYCTRQDMNICGACAGPAALSDLRREEIKDERLRRRGLGARGQSEEKVQCGPLPAF